MSINELLLSIRRLQKVSPDTKLQTIVQVLDQDKDGRIDINNALQVCLLGALQGKKKFQKNMEVGGSLQVSLRILFCF